MVQRKQNSWFVSLIHRDHIQADIKCRQIDGTPKIHSVKYRGVKADECRAWKTSDLILSITFKGCLVFSEALGPRDESSFGSSCSSHTLRVVVKTRSVTRIGQ